MSDVAAALGNYLTIDSKIWIIAGIVFAGAVVITAYNTYKRMKNHDKEESKNQSQND